VNRPPGVVGPTLTPPFLRHDPVRCRAPLRRAIRLRRTVALVFAAVLAGGRASGQETRPSLLAIDTEAAVDVAVDENGNDTTNLFFDSVVSARLARNVEAIVRPFVQRLGAAGEWNRQIWVAAVRYERHGPIGIRVDGGLIPSPVGYANLLLRPHLNPTIAQPSSLFTPLPAVETRGPRATLLGAIYPYGVNATVSARWWDARVSFMDTSPLRTRRIFAETNPPRFANIVVGGGITPVVGLRIGTSVTHGGWLKAGELPGTTQGQDATVVTVEADYSVAYTKVAGEWTRDAFGTSHGDTSASGWFVQGQQTLTPRWFAAARVEHMSAPGLVAATGTFDVMQFNGTEEVVGFRLTPAITLRVGHRARKAFNSSAYLNAGTISVVWWKRWL
jgi:hypothetical protein